MSAISPSIVLSPIFITIPIPYPSLQRVPKNATFAVSRSDSGWVHTIVLSYGSLSPVNAELSTFISFTEISLISAGIFSPALTCTMSPRTSFSGS